MKTSLVNDELEGTRKQVAVVFTNPGSLLSGNHNIEGAAS
jgi:hypothetical protein